MQDPDPIAAHERLHQFMPAAGPARAALRNCLGARDVRGALIPIADSRPAKWPY